jgi:hypothetical protein
MGLKIWSLSNPAAVSNQQPFDHWLNALTNCANRAHKRKEQLKRKAHDILSLERQSQSTLPIWPDARSP